MSSLTVTLTLVVRKAVSLVLSVLLYGDGGVHNLRMWAGGVMVLVGTVGYSVRRKNRVGTSLQVMGNRRESKEKEE